MPHLNLNWTGMTTPSMRTCCKAVSGECLCDALSWSALPTLSGRTGNTKTPDTSPRTRQLEDSRIQFVCVTFYGDWELLILHALSQCIAISLPWGWMERIFIEEECGKKCTFYSNVVTVHELPGWVEGRYLKLTSSWIICGSMLYSLVWTRARTA